MCWLIRVVWWERNCYGMLIIILFIIWLLVRWLWVWFVFDNENVWLLSMGVNFFVFVIWVSVVSILLWVLWLWLWIIGISMKIICKFNLLKWIGDKFVFSKEIVVDIWLFNFVVVKEFCKFGLFMVLYIILKFLFCVWVWM